MKLTIETSRLQELITRAVKGAGNDKTVPVTEFMVIEVKDEALKITTTDATNYLYLTSKLEGAEDFYVAVKTETFVQLILKMTCEKTTLEVTDSYLCVKGNGNYKIELEPDVDGSALHLADPAEGITTEVIGTIKDTDVYKILNSVKPALSKDERPFTYYYVGGKVIGTDGYMISSYDKAVLDSPILITSELMDLLGLLVGDITITRGINDDSNKLIFIAENGSVYGSIPNGIENYSEEEISNMVSESFECSCKVAKAPVLSLLSRIALFVGVFDNGEITLTFDTDSLEVSSKYATEKIAYLEQKNVVNPFICRTDIKALMTQIKAQLGDTLEIEFGSDSAIKLIDGDITSVLALLVD